MRHIKLLMKGLPLSIAILALISVSSVFAQAAEPGQAPADQKTASTDQGGEPDKLRDLILNDFEEAEDWRAFATCPLGETKAKKVVQRGELRDVFNENETTQAEKDKFQPGINNILGVKTFFQDKGFDRVEVKPPHEYAVKGLGRQISIWALGRKYRHTLYVKLRDYRGKLHKLRLGRLDYLGWRKLTVTIPGWVPQSSRFALMDKNLHFVSLYVVSDNHEIPGQFYFYLDDLSMKVDKSDMEYPGSQIKDTW